MIDHTSSRRRLLSTPAWGNSQRQTSTEQPRGFYVVVLAKPDPETMAIFLAQESVSYMVLAVATHWPTGTGLVMLPMACSSAEFGVAV